MPASAWETVFMLLVLKIPVVYLCAVVWWAIRAEPRPLEGAAVTSSLDREPPCDWRSRWARRRPAGTRTPRRPLRPNGTPGVALARHEGRR